MIHRRNYFIKSLLVIIYGSFSMYSQSIETKLVVRAKARDAKFIGSSIGGALVIVRDSETSEIIAKGVTQGNTGDTRKIMIEPKSRNDVLADEDTAAFKTILNLSEPKLLTIEVQSPISHKQATITNTSQIWMIPGKDIEGDGHIVEIPGFIVDIISPQTHETISGQSMLMVKANIVMMCGCTISNGGLWDSNSIEVKALLIKEDDKKMEIPLTNSQNNTFESTLPLAENGLYQLTVYAYDKKTNNTGVDKTNFIINKK